jgi:membrane associated rhomboid family serine protease
MLRPAIPNVHRDFAARLRFSRHRPKRQSSVSVDINHILLFIAFIAPLVLLARTRRALGLHRTWRLAALTVLLVTVGAWLVRRDYAGFIGGGAWFFLLLIPAVGLRKLRALVIRRRFSAARHLATALRVVHPSHELIEVRNALDLRMHGDAAGADVMLASWIDSTRPPLEGTQRRSRPQSTPVVFTLIALNLMMFAAEFALGSTTDPATLHRLGALEWPPVLIRGEYWRLVTALFLHYGPLHLLFNLYALYVLGPALENAIGSARFAVCYFFAGICSTGGVLLLRVIGFTQADQVVGASGSIMGLIGAWAGLLVRHRHTPFATRRLQNILLVVVVQVMFDVTTPEVSTAAHLCGLVGGFVSGLILAPRRLPA